MVDVFSKEKRSWIMSRIKSNNTKIDVRMKQVLSDLNCNYEMYPKIYGNPDFVIKKHKIAIFCDGDFWHGYRYHEKKKPSKKFWREKIENNMKRDRRISAKLRRDGWSVLRFWEHDVEDRIDVCINRLLRKISVLKTL